MENNNGHLSTSISDLSFKSHLRKFADMYVLIASWWVAGVIAPVAVSAVYSVLTFLLVLRTRNVSKILLMLLTVLIFSDSRLQFMRFAALGKPGFVVLLALFVLFNRREFRGFDNRVFVYFLPFLAFGVLATIWSSDAPDAFQKSLSYGLVYLLVPLCFQKASAQDEGFHKHLIYYFMVVLLTGFIMYILSPDMATLANRYRGVFGNPNGLGIFLTVLFSVAFVVRYTNRKLFSKTDEVLFALLFFASLVFCGSRTTIIAILIFLLFYLMRHLPIMLRLVVFVAIVGSYEYLLTKLPEIITVLGLGEYFRINTLEEGSGRLIAWAFGWEKIQEVFFFGGGFAHTENIYRAAYDELSRLGHQGNAHNSFLTLWLNTGLVGMVLFAVGFLRLAVVSFVKSPLGMPVLFSILFSANFESWIAASLNPVTSVFLMSAALLTSNTSPKEL